MKALTFLTLFVISIAFSGCEEEYADNRTYPEIRTLQPIDINEEGVTLTGIIDDLNGNEILEHGFVWGIHETLLLTSSDRVYFGPLDKTGIVEHRVTTTLEEGKDYYVSLYAMTATNTVYGTPIKFRSMGCKGHTITGFFPQTAAWGDTITITGEGFSFTTYLNRVFLGPVLITSMAKSSDTILKFILPSTVTAWESVLAVELGGKKITFSQYNLVLVNYGKGFTNSVSNRTTMPDKLQEE